MKRFIAGTNEKLTPNVDDDYGWTSSEEEAKKVVKVGKGVVTM